MGLGGAGVRGVGLVGVGVGRAGRAVGLRGALGEGEELADEMCVSFTDRNGSVGLYITRFPSSLQVSPSLFSILCFPSHWDRADLQLHFI